jgi:hypothetical protein
VNLNNVCAHRLLSPCPAEREIPLRKSEAEVAVEASLPSPPLTASWRSIGRARKQSFLRKNNPVISTEAQRAKQASAVERPAVTRTPELHARSHPEAPASSPAGRGISRSTQPRSGRSSLSLNRSGKARSQTKQLPASEPHDATSLAPCYHRRMFNFGKPKTAADWVVHIAGAIVAVFLVWWMLKMYVL